MQKFSYEAFERTVHGIFAEVPQHDRAGAKQANEASARSYRVAVS